LSESKTGIGIDNVVLSSNVPKLELESKPHLGIAIKIILYAIFIA
jgi:hypothetical protein